DSLDLVYFDPMFRNTREQSASLRPLKPWICQDPLNVASVQEACRTARRVVLKERNGSPEFARLGFRVLDGGRYSSVAFGALEKES
ncbi:MAG: protein-glutamate O-methyltransferase, partial [Gracilibacteraceae bacterium]|nr:protein-glutamate O-methyltransferase [Gracilibacteraceae bacterium]